MERATHATTPSAVKLETSAREQQVDAPGYIVLQKKGAKHLILTLPKKQNLSTVAATIPLIPF